MPDPEIIISMNKSTIEKLQNNGYRLYSFIPVVSSNRSGVPLIWARRDNYLQQITITVPSAADAYITFEQVSENCPIHIGNKTKVSPRDLVTVESKSGEMFITGNQASVDTIYIGNNSQTVFNCGLAIEGSGALVPTCAFNLLPYNLVSLSPTNAIFLMWTTSLFDPGVYVRSSMGAGLLINFNGESTREVTYEIDRGWQASTPGANWAQTVGFGADLAKLLILPQDQNKP